MAPGPDVELAPVEESTRNVAYDYQNYGEFRAQEPSQSIPLIDTFRSSEIFKYLEHDFLLELIDNIQFRTFAKGMNSSSFSWSCDASDAKKQGTRILLGKSTALQL